MNSPTPTPVAPRFGIAEWYGHSFVGLTDDERKAFAGFKPDKASRLPKSERERLAALEKKVADGRKLSEKESQRLTQLQAKKAKSLAGNKVCPFKGQEPGALCTKDGGVCSLRLYEIKNGQTTPVSGDRGEFRALCPSRFHEDLKIFKWVGKTILGDPTPKLAGEVGFLESSETVDSDEGADVGRIDMVLINSTATSATTMNWCALEIQAVYFSGKEMAGEFKAIAQAESGSLLFPVENRRPDYRSSGPKRLMPQLQIKVPTLRRWGKKMAVVIDRAFFDSIGQMDNVKDPSNSDIAWFIVRFQESEDGKRASLITDEIRYTTLERAVEGLTGGTPIPLHDFESRIWTKLGVSESSPEVSNAGVEIFPQSSLQLESL